MKTRIRSCAVLFLACIISSLSAQPGTHFLEAEDGTLTSVSVMNTNPGFSGKGYVSNITSDNSSIVFNFESNEGLFNLILGYATPNGSKGCEIVLNGTTITAMLPNVGKTFSTNSLGKVELTEGQNSLVIKRGWGWYDLDYIMLQPATAALLKTVPDSLIDASASSETRSLFRFLLYNYGKKILSGQQEESDINYIKNITGKTPAVGHFDFMDYSPSRIQFGANPAGNAEKMINWSKRTNGLVSISWHWNAPTDLINEEPDKLWWSGFYTRATTFDIQATLADTSSERYHLLLRDMDAIAVQLKKFQNEGIPVLWRPLHEASGTWFWWGAKGHEAYIKLWRLMVSRFRDYHQIHNLIWVYTTGDPQWYPGDDWVDIVSHDIYTSKGSPMSAQWEETFNQFNGKKIVTLSESGTLPVMDKVTKYGTWWSYFSLWTGDFIRSYPHNDVREAYSHSLVINAEDLPDWKNFIVSTEQHDFLPSSINVSFYPNPFNPVTTLKIVLKESSNISIEVFSVLGKSVMKMEKNGLSLGENYIRLDAGELNSGVYLVKITANSEVFVRKITLLK